MVTEYLYEWNKQRYASLNHRKLKKVDSLDMTVVDGGYLLPNRYGPNRMFGYGGVADVNGQYVQASEMDTYAKYVRETKPEDIQICYGPTYEIDINESHPYLDETIVYLGYLNNHWGHLLIDYSTRLWYFLENEKKEESAKPLCRYAYVVDENADFQMIANIRRFFELLGILDRLILVNQVTKCRQIIIPKPSYITNGYYSEQHLQVFQKVADRVDCSKFPTYEKIYYGRQSLEKARGSEVGEEVLANLFQKNGFTMIAPETLSLDEQIAMIRNSELLVALSGSIGHNLLFSKEGQKMIILNKTHNINMAQQDVDEMKKAEVLYIDAYLAKFPVLNGEGPFFIYYSEPLRKYAEEQNWQQPNAALISEAALLADMKQHVHSFRQKRIRDLKLHYEKDAQYFDYFAPEHLIQWEELFYHLEQPVSGAEKREYETTRIKNGIKRRIH